jgi:hypothetical protein
MFIYIFYIHYIASHFKYALYLNNNVDKATSLFLHVLLPLDALFPNVVMVEEMR